MRGSNGGAAARPSGRRLLAVTAFVAVLLAACAPSGGPNDRATLQYVKRTFYGELADTDASLIAAGLLQPVVEFTVNDTPPSIFVNYVIPDEQAAAFAAHVALPPAFSLAKVRIVETDPVPRYWLSLNVYRVSGITTGLRAEWSTYVDDGSGEPRFMIVRARAAEGSLDPLGPVAPAEPFDHRLDPDEVIRTTMNRFDVQGDTAVWTPDHLFTSSIALPDPAARNFVDPTDEWVAANDFIYWINGVNDKTFYNSTAHQAPLISVDLADVTLDDDTEWVPFIDPVPAHVLVYLDRLEFAIGPWWNVTEPDGRVDPATRAFLFEQKKSIYGGLAQLQAVSIRTGEAQPTLLSSVDDAPPSTYWHWKIDPADLAAFAAAARLPAGLSLAPTRLEAGDPDAAQWLTLHVYRSSRTLTSELRAEWSTTVDDGSGIRTLTLEAQADEPWLDPTNVVNTTYPFTAAAAISHAVAGPSLDTTVGSGPTAFTSSVPVPATGSPAAASREWVGSQDLRYWTNKVIDRRYYDSEAFAPGVSVDPATVSVVDGGQWASFTAGAPDRVWVDEDGADVVLNPWWNI